MPWRHPVYRSELVNSASVHIEDIYKTAIEVRPQYDMVSAVDVHVGTVNNVECSANGIWECHLAMNTICKMMENCNVYRLHNPDLVAAWCQLGESDVPLMNLWNDTLYSGP